MRLLRFMVILIGLGLFSIIPLFAQETESPVESDNGTGFFDNVSFFVEHRLVGAVSAPNVGFGFAGMANVQYTFPFHLSVGLETGYCGFKSEIDTDNDSIKYIGGYTLIPAYMTAAYNFRLMEGFYIAPVLKFGGAYLNSRLNGWVGSDSFAMLFEGGVRVFLHKKGGLLIEGSVFYTGIIEKSGLFSIISLGLGFGL